MPTHYIRGVVWIGDWIRIICQLIKLQIIGQIITQQKLIHQFRMYQTQIPQTEVLFNEKYGQMGRVIVEVQELKIIGGGHEWPGTSGNMDVNANNEIWQFLSKFDKNGMIDTLNIEDLEIPISVIPNPFNDHFIIEGAENELIELYDLRGRKVQSRLNNNFFNTESLKRGVYILILNEKDISFKLVKS